MVKRRQLDAGYKAKVALAAIKGEKTMAEISSHFEVHSTQITRWRRQAVEGLVQMFASGQGRKSPEMLDQERLIENLYQEIGKLKMENEWLKKKSEILIP